MSKKLRIIELQRALKVAKDALALIQNGCSNPEFVAEDALYRMHPLEPKVQTQGLCGHGQTTAVTFEDEIPWP